MMIEIEKEVGPEHLVVPSSLYVPFWKSFYFSIHQKQR